MKRKILKEIEKRIKAIDLKVAVEQDTLEVLCLKGEKIALLKLSVWTIKNT